MADPQAMAQLASLGPAELDEVRQQLAQELNTFHQNALTLGQTASKFAAAGQAVEQLSEQAAGQAVLLPLTESLYVSGRLARVDSVLLEVGTGYYVEKDVAGGVDYCRRKVLLVQENTKALAQMIRARQAALQQVDALLEQKLGAAEAAAAKTGGAA